MRPTDITGALWDRILKLDARLGAYNANLNCRVIPDFGFFLDTHRDQPHVGTFGTDIHRGMCNPVMVGYSPDQDCFVLDDVLLQRHKKHQFIDPEFLAKYEIECLMNGVELRNTDGHIPTSHFRDARAKKYYLWSFRQAVMAKYNTL